MQTLRPGWNLVGWSGATSGPEAFDFITGDFRVGFTYAAVSQTFESFSPDTPAILNSLDELAFGDGVWIFAEQETTWLQPAPWWQRDVDLHRGFNLVLWTGGNGTPVAEAVASLGDALVSLFTWEAAAQQFFSYGPGRLDFLNTARTLDYGDGVWLEVNRDSTWSQPAPQRVGTQDVWFIRTIAKVDAEGNDVEEITTRSCRPPTMTWARRSPCASGSSSRKRAA